MSNNDEKKNHLKLVGTEALRGLPMPRLQDEAVALLVACNSLLNAFALQNIQIPTMLLHDLRLFCRENTGFDIPFPTLATKVVDVGKDQSTLWQLQHVGHTLADKAKDLGILVHNLSVQADVGVPVDARAVLSKLGELELQMERLQAFFGWSKMMVRVAARNKLDADGVSID